MSTRYVEASEHDQLQRDHAELLVEHQRLQRAAHELQTKSYEEGREAARREYLRERSVVGEGDGLAHLTLPDNGGAIQFHATGPHGPRPITGGFLTPDPDFLLRIWGPPDESAHYGIHEQGGGNVTDFSMAFDLTTEGMVIHDMRMTGLRSQWDRKP